MIQIEREKLDKVLEALERSVATCFNQYAHQQVMSQPDHFINTAITALKEALAQHDSVQAKPEPEQEPVAWGVDWGKAGDIPCVSIIKRLPDGGIKVMAVEYAPYSYTTPPKQEPVRIMGFNCKCGRRMEVSAEQGVVPAPQRTWVGLTVEDVHDCLKGLPTQSIEVYARSVEAKLKEKNNG